MLQSESSGNGKEVMTSVLCKAQKRDFGCVLNPRKKNEIWELDASA
jgi:hypothetical protein